MRFCKYIFDCFKGALATVTGGGKAPIDESPEFDPIPPRRGAVLTQRETEVFEVLEEHATASKPLHVWYRGAVATLNARGPDYLAQTAHSIREVAEKLPDLVGGVQPIVSPLVKMQGVRHHFNKVRKQHDGHWENWEGPVGPRVRKLMKSMEAVFTVMDAPPRSARLRTALTSRDAQQHVITKRKREERDRAFVELGNYFQKVCHHGISPKEEELRSRIREFERLILSYLGTTTKEEQDELFRLGSEPPTDQALRRVESLILLKGANFAYFFKSFSDPGWLDYLGGAGYFQDLPEVVEHEDGSKRYPPHLPIVSLSRFAEEAPEKITEILETLELPDHRHVVDDVLRVVAEIKNPELIPRLRSVVHDALNGPSSTLRVWVQDVFRTWMGAGATKQTADALKPYFVAAASDWGGPRPDPWAVAKIDQMVGDELTQLHPREIADGCVAALVRWSSEEKERTVGETGPFAVDIAEYSDPEKQRPHTLWLESFGRGGGLGHDLEQTLAARLYDASKKIYENEDSEQIELLERRLREHRWHLFDRLRCQLYFDFPSVAKTLARKEALEALTSLGTVENDYSFELATMLRTHSEAFGSEFLTTNEIKQAAGAVFDRPLLESDGGEQDVASDRRFRLRLLWPLLPLLKGEERDRFDRLAEECPGLMERFSLEKFIPFKTSGSRGARDVVDTAPMSMGELGKMPNDRLFERLRTWTPAHWSEGSRDDFWRHESHYAQAFEFARLMEIELERFDPADEWWTEIEVPEYLQRPLERAAVRVSEGKNAREKDVPEGAPTEREWANWIRMAESIVSWHPINPDEEERKAGAHDWTWARQSVARFLTALLGSKREIPSACSERIPGLLRELIEAEDGMLTTKDDTMFHDWNSIAINSVRGIAVEALIHLAWNQKKKGGEAEPWIFDFLQDRLSSTDQSPAIFSLLGSKLGLLVWLFGERIAAQPELLFPPDRAMHRLAAVAAHYNYDRIRASVLEAIPQFPQWSLDCCAYMEELQGGAEGDLGAESKFGSQMGTHFMLHYGNEDFESEEIALQVVDRFFEVARPEHRTRVIRSVGRIFEKGKSDPDHMQVYERVMEFCERRLHAILAALNNGARIDDCTSELGQFISLIGCECFDYHWRVQTVLAAMEPLEKIPWIVSELEILSEWSADPQRLGDSIRIFQGFTERYGDDIRWALRRDEVKPMIQRGLHSEDGEIRDLAQRARENLLLHGHDELLSDGEQ